MLDGKILVHVVDAYCFEAHNYILQKYNYVTRVVLFRDRSRW